MGDGARPSFSLHSSQMYAKKLHSKYKWFFVSVPAERDTQMSESIISNCSNLDIVGNL